MKNSLGRLIVCMSVLLVACVSNCVFAEEKPTQGNDAPRKMNISRYDEAARGINAPMYAYYAQKIKERTGITKGVCIDVGSGGGYLGLALAKITDLDFIFLDISADALEKAKIHIIEDGLHERAKTLLADVHSIPLPDGSVNLIISRGSIPFWKDPAKALKEIYRILAPGGQAYVGGGRGTPEIQAQVAAKRKEVGVGPWDKPMGDKGPTGKGPGGMAQRNYEEILKTTGIKNYAIDKGNDGMWIQMWK